MVCGHMYTHRHTRTCTHIVTYSVSPAALTAGHERSVEEWNVWYDLQPKCQCFAVVSRERERHGETEEGNGISMCS